MEIEDEWDGEAWEEEEYLDEDYDEDDESETVACPNCGADVYEDAEQCPACGHYIVPSSSANPWSRHPLWIGFVVLSVFALILGLVSTVWLALST